MYKRQFQVIAQDYNAPGPLAPGHPFAHGDANAKPLFAEFGHTSVAAASLGQVYKARTWDGRDIVCSRVCEGDFGLTSRRWREVNTTL